MNQQWGVDIVFLCHCAGFTRQPSSAQDWECKEEGDGK